MSSRNLISTISTVLTRFPEISFATLFGSASTGRMVASSDVDIAVAGLGKLSIEQRFSIAEALSSELGREVDLVDLNQVSGLILEQAICHSILIMNKKPELYARLIKKLWYDQADMMPYVDRILKQRREAWLQ